MATSNGSQLQVAIKFLNFCMPIELANIDAIQLAHVEAEMPYSRIACQFGAEPCGVFTQLRGYVNPPRRYALSGLR
jgi:hypothetical protein